MPPDRKTCISSKIRYPDELTARQEKNRINNRLPKGVHKAKFVYECPWCSGWHTTKDPRKKTNR